VDASTWPEAMYFARVTFGNGTVSTVKFVKRN